MAADRPGSASQDSERQVPYHDREFEQALPGALSAVVDGFPAYDPEVIARGVARGRQLRRGRRIRLGAAACALTVAAVGGGVALDRSLEADGSPASRRTVPDTELPTGWPVTGNQMVSVLKSLVPAAGKVSEVSGEGSQATPKDPPLIARDPFAKLVYSDARGKSGVEVKLSRPAPGTADSRLTDCGAVDGRRPYDECKTTERADGSKLTVTKIHTNAWGDARQRFWRVVLDRPDGGRIAVGAHSGGVRDQHIGSANGVIGVHEDPRLTIADLTRIATDSHWDRAVTALPTPDKRMLAVLEDLLPPGTNVISKGEPEYGATLVIGDARGRSTVTASMGYPNTPLETCAGRADCRTETLPDGTTTLAVRQSVGNGPPEFLDWRASVRYPDGRMVWVSAGNGVSPGLVLNQDPDSEGALFEYTGGKPEPSRSEPALTLDQLRTMAADPRWRQ
ncbi:hypothetical protein [Embleya sp. NPDC005971]|uniref:hypothetical protein n=1 Tax=unclassified Embleya TaxID=2699296 RepID=UPI0033D390A5